ncbi:hypothetical protein NPIL_91731 [Nephila pilipes]|uniref:Uncharacterized protein n=1 Tax=Nephila pilipes TaxID=299642 RepID=A0A8X6TPE3_NEPPI|nr:hypothetical protein NPIL_91731 [Nephila pilipes]
MFSNQTLRTKWNIMFSNSNHILQIFVYSISKPLTSNTFLIRLKRFPSIRVSANASQTLTMKGILALLTPFGSAVVETIGSWPCLTSRMIIRRSPSQYGLTPDKTESGLMESVHN